VTHPFDQSTIIAQWPKHHCFTIGDSLAGGLFCSGQTSAGKSSAVLKYTVMGMLQADYALVFLTVKREDAAQYLRWAKEAGRECDVVFFDASGRHRFNFLEWEAQRDDGAGKVINITALLYDIARAVAGGAGAEGHASGDARFFDGVLHLFLTVLVALAIASGEEMSVPLLRRLADGAAKNLTELHSREWKENSPHSALLTRLSEAEASMDANARADLAEIFTFFTSTWPALSDRTKSIVDIMWSRLVQPFMFAPLRDAFTTYSTVTPDQAFEEGKIVIVDLPAQLGLAYRMGGLIWKICFQTAALRRVNRTGQPLRPACLVMDEAQNFLQGPGITGGGDAAFAAVSRSSAASMIILLQNLPLMRSAMGDDDACRALLGNLTTKIACANSDAETNRFFSELVGSRWIDVTTRNVGQSLGRSGDDSHLNGGSSRTPQKRAWIEPEAFNELMRGGPAFGHRVSAIVHRGTMFDQGDGEPPAPFLKLVFNQLR